MRIFNKLDETSLKAFYFAAETLSFTQAAKAAALTQSGISQHVARLEEQLQVSLFHRAGRKVSLTGPGKRLKKFVETYLDNVDGLLEEVRGETQDIVGLVRYAMPNSCLLTPHFPNQKPIRFRDLDLTGEINNLEGAIAMVAHGVGIGVFPLHCVETLLNKNKLKKYPTEKSTNPIYIVTPKGQKLTARVYRVLETFWDMV